MHDIYKKLEKYCVMVDDKEKKDNGNKIFFISLAVILVVMGTVIYFDHKKH